MKHELTTVEFHGATLIAVRGETPAETLVAMKPVVEGMGLDWEEQRRKLHRHPVLASALTFATVQMPGDDQRREWAFLPLTRVNFWLATVQPGRVKNPATKAKVIEYQTECADVLFAHFFGKAAGVPVSLTQKLVLVREARLSGFSKAELQEMWIELGLPSTGGMKARVLRRQLDLFGSRPLGQA
ncbi:phage antirepressor N-terminal domain-containing protein [Azospirillum sp. Marseille-Q6669]